MPFPMRSAPLLGQLAAIADRFAPIPIVPLHADPPPSEHDRRAALPSRISNSQRTGETVSNSNGGGGIDVSPCALTDTSAGATPVEWANRSSSGAAPSPSDGDFRQVVDESQQHISNSSNRGGGNDVSPLADASAGATPVEWTNGSSSGADPSPSDGDFRQVVDESNTGGGVDHAPRAVSPPLDDVAALFADVPEHPSKKRKCQRQRLSESEKIQTAFAAIEGVRAVVNLLAAATKPVASSSAPLAKQISECMLYSTEQLERCASVLDLSCTNTAAKKCASSAHRKFEGEERRRQEGEQLLVRGIGEVSAHDELVHALEDAKAAFTRLSKKKMQCSLVLQLIPVGIAIDPSSKNDCLTRLDEGMLCWSEGALNKIDSFTMENKMMKLTLSMFALFLNLMLDKDDSLSQGSFFEEFMSEFNLLTKNVP